eukprot:2387141-Rhodomonas_salina.2
MPGTAVGCAAAMRSLVLRSASAALSLGDDAAARYQPPLSSYPVSDTSLQASYAMSGTDMQATYAMFSTAIQASYAMSGTERGCVQWKRAISSPPLASSAETLRTRVSRPVPKDRGLRQPVSLRHIRQALASLVPPPYCPTPLLCTLRY